MDDSVLELFQSKFLVTGEVHDPVIPHPHYTLYKAKREGYGSQETRRKEFMEQQKARRRNFADLARKLADGSDVSEDDSGEEMEEGGGVDEVDGKGVSADTCLVLQYQWVYENSLTSDKNPVKIALWQYILKLSRQNVQPDSMVGCSFKLKAGPF